MNKEQKVLNKIITNSIEKYFNGMDAKEAIRDSVNELTEKEKVLLERVNKDVLEV
ncbi:hypothetical protein [Clostridium perfringens]|uniref:hypothetical protein n=1 Tax=Clostridium perfringens TaxID=1502 RepID=UPI0008A70B6F|nr:hypothetical protein [Clostridium perfringens]AOY53837.1 hypothetical protein FORC25_1422 [Clostridium perfringens]MDK0856932.1 hypothetical protein [Clostridium perfringens]MDM0730232.1 hypothetical protein [Clostridium perfringens]UBK45257.1 hypothetical protein KLF34_07030 [Clostridium perfringens]